VDANQPTTAGPARVSSLAGKPAPASLLADVPKLIASYHDDRPDPGVPEQRVKFGTSGHRGSPVHVSFNEWHILAITQAICAYRSQQQIDGPLFLAADTHALSAPALQTTLEVLAANGVVVCIDAADGFTPTPALSHAILAHNRGRTRGLADGIVITPSHNPPEDGGFKYNPPHGGPADTDATGAIETLANELMTNGLADVQRMPYERAVHASTTRRYDFLGTYVSDLGAVLDFDLMRASGLAVGVDPLGGAGVRYWPAIADRYRLGLTITNSAVDPTFRFMDVDWDGRIRMDPSSPYAMHSLVALKDRFDIAFACDTDHDRHGIVTRSAGLLPANHYLTACIHYLFAHREWGPVPAVGKTVVSSSVIDRVTAGLGRTLYEVPVGFKWFVEGLLKGRLGFVGEESAGATFLRRDGTVWTTEKDGIVAALLSMEMTARLGRDPGESYRTITQTTGSSEYERIDAPANTREKAALARLSPGDVHGDLAGQPIRTVLTHAPGNGEAIGGIKVSTDDGWFAARPSGTEDVYKIYAESFSGLDHLRLIQTEAQRIVSDALSRAAPR